MLKDLLGSLSGVLSIISIVLVIVMGAYLTVTFMKLSRAEVPRK